MNKKTKQAKKLVAIVLTIAMVLSMMPANVWADNSMTHTHYICGETHKDIGDHDRDDETTFEAWPETTSLPTSGKYYLTKDVTIDSNVSLSENVTLCLNGHTVNVVNSATIKVNGGGKLILTDCADQQGTIQGSGQPGIEIIGSKDTDTIYPASFIMYGGTITGFAVAVRAGDHSNFTMYGGKITDNNTGSAAAVSGKAGSGATSTIAMYGGEISHNTGEAGGGVYVGEKCTFTLAGGTISQNTATGHTNNDTAAGSDLQAKDGGGGVYLDHLGSFIMTGGEIAGNSANGNGGGICVMTFAAASTINITGGKIINNAANGSTGGGIYGGPATLNIENTTISGNTCAGSGGGIYTNKPLTLEDAQIINNEANKAGGSEGGGVKIGGDSKNFKGEDALTVSGNTSISDNSPNNYYVNQSYLLPIKVSGNLSDKARIGICLNKDTATDVSNDKFLPTTTSDSVVATAVDGVTLDYNNFTADNSDYDVRIDVSDGVKFGLCEHNVPEGSNECSKCHTTFVAVLNQDGQKAEYFIDLSKGADLSGKTGTLKLLQDVTLSTGLISVYGSTLTLDLNGHTISGGRIFTLNNGAALTIIDSSDKATTERTLDVVFTVNADCTLNLYDGTNEQGFRGTVKMVQLWRTGTLVSCGGTISKLWLSKSDSDYGTDWDVRLWQSNTQYCTVGTIQYRVNGGNITVSEFLKKNHPGAMLYGTKNGGVAEKISGDTIIDCDNGVGGDGGYTNLHLKACEQHEPVSDSKLTCKHCGAELVVKISAMKDGTEQVGYFPQASKDKATWLSGYAEASAQLADWVADGYMDAKLLPLTDNTQEIPVACKMTLVGTGHTGIDVLVKDGADVLLEGGEYDDVTVTGGKAMLKGEKYNYYGVKVRGGEAVFESGTCSGYFEMDGGTVIIKNDTTFTNIDTTAFQVKKGTLHVEGGTIKSPVKISNPVNLAISGGAFKGQQVVIQRSKSYKSVCTISGGEFDKLTLSGSDYKLSDLLASGCAYYKDGAIVSGEGASLENVTVMSGHEHNPDANTGVCSECKMQMASSVTAGETTTYYVTHAEAVDALNKMTGEKTLKLFKGYTTWNVNEEYMLTSGPVTLDLNGKNAQFITFTAADGVVLTLKSTTATEGEYVSVVQAIGKGSKIIADSDNINVDSKMIVGRISAQNGGRLELSAGTFWDLYVVKGDGSSASLKGGTYQPSRYNYGSGPVDKGVEFVGAFDLLADGYGYKQRSNSGVFNWLWNSSFVITTRETYKVEKYGVSFKKIYPNDEENYTDDTYLIRLGENEETGSLTLTAVSAPADKANYSWEIYDRTQDKWIPATSASGNTNIKLTITELPVGTYRYRVEYSLLDGEGQTAYRNYSDPLTVVVTKHEHSWAYTAEDATIKATCMEPDCYLADGNGGSVTINAPECETYRDGKDEAATLTWTNWVDDVTKDNVEKSINYTGTSNNDKEYKSNIAPTDAGNYNASITVGNTTASVEYTIAAKEITIASATAAGRTYEQGDSSVDVDVAFNGLVSGETLEKGKDYTVTGTMANANAGENKIVNVTVTLNNSNYELSQNKTSTTVNIAKAVDTTVVPTDEYVFFKLAKTYTFNPPALPEDCGKVSYSLGVVDLDSSFYEKGATLNSETGVLTLPIESAVIPAVAGNAIGMVTIIAVTENYKDIELTINVIGKYQTTITGGEPTLSPTEITYGEPLSTIKLSGSMQAGDKTVEGAFSWQDGTTKPAAGTHSAKWIFAPNEPEYETYTGTATITVNKANLTGVTVSQTGTLEYTGEQLAATVQTAATAVNNQEVTFTYSNAKDGTYSETVPAFEEAGKHTVYYKASAAHHNDEKGSFIVTIEPAVVTTTDKPTQDTVYAGTEVSKVTFKENKVNVTFNGKTKVLEGSWSIVAKDGATKFDKAGKYICEATFTPNDKNFAPITISDIEITVTNRPSGGGGGAVIPTTEVVTKDKVTTAPAEVRNETKTDEAGNRVTTAIAIVSDANQKEIIKQVKDNKSEEIIINVSEKDIADDASLEINLDKEFIDSIVNDTDAKLTIKTPAGDRTFTKEELKKLSEASTGDTITIDPTDDDSDKAEKIAKAKELTAGLGLTARSGKTAKGNVNVVLKNSTKTKDSIKELEELGFTVKYRFYRSTKKSSVYKSMVTKNTDSYTNTTGKKGTKYYYKVRVMIYDADGSLVAKSDLKQCRYASRTWSK